MNIYLEVSLVMMVVGFLTCMFSAITAAGDMLITKPPKRNFKLLKYIALFYIVVMVGVFIAGILEGHSL